MTNPPPRPPLFAPKAYNLDADLLCEFLYHEAHEFDPCRDVPAGVLWDRRTSSYNATLDHAALLVLRQDRAFWLDRLGDRLHGMRDAPTHTCTQYDQSILFRGNFRGLWWIHLNPRAATPRRPHAPDPLEASLDARDLAWTVTVSTDRPLGAWRSVLTRALTGLDPLGQSDMARTFERATEELHPWREFLFGHTAPFFGDLFGEGPLHVATAPSPGACATDDGSLLLHCTRRPTDDELAQLDARATALGAALGFSVVAVTRRWNYRPGTAPRPTREPLPPTVPPAGAPRDLSEALAAFGGIVGRLPAGATVLLFGAPGAGKAELLLRFAQDYASRDVPILYVTYESSHEQVYAQSGGRGVPKFSVAVDPSFDIVKMLIQVGKPQVVIYHAPQRLLHGDASLRRMNELSRIAHTSTPPHLAIVALHALDHTTTERDLLYQFDVVLELLPTYAGVRLIHHRNRYASTET